LYHSRTPSSDSADKFLDPGVRANNQHDHFARHIPRNEGNPLNNDLSAGPRSRPFVQVEGVGEAVLFFQTYDVIMAQVAQPVE